MTSKAMRLQDRDLALMAEVAVVGLLDTATLWQRHFAADRSGKACLRRLRLYCGHELLEAIPVSVAFASAQSGRPQRLFRLTQRGAEVLRELTGRTDIHFSRKEPRPETLLHRLGVAKLRLRVNDACVLQHLPEPRWISEYDTVPGVRFEAKFLERFVICEKLRNPEGKHVSCWPDASCCLRIPHPATSGDAHLVVYWEYDRSTETLTQVAGKLPGYHALLTSATWQKHWPHVPNPAVRVFFVVQSDERRRNIASAIKNLPGADAIRLATVTDITPQRFLTDPIWKTVSGEARPILRNSPAAS